MTAAESLLLLEKTMNTLNNSKNAEIAKLQEKRAKADKRLWDAVYKTAGKKKKRLKTQPTPRAKLKKWLKRQPDRIMTGAEVDNSKLRKRLSELQTNPEWEERRGALFYLAGHMRDLLSQKLNSNMTADDTRNAIVEVKKEAIRKALDEEEDIYGEDDYEEEMGEELMELDEA